jgi:hypothetical protein
MSIKQKHLTYYTPVTGEIVATVSGESQPSLAHLNSIDGIHPADIYYISGGVAKERREMLLTVKGLTITGIPVHSKVTINGGSFEVDDGSVEITRPGSMPVLVQVEHINYLKKEYRL